MQFDGIETEYRNIGAYVIGKLIRTGVRKGASAYQKDWKADAKSNHYGTVDTHS